MVNHTAALFSLIISLFLEIIASWPPRQKERERGSKIIKIMCPERNTQRDQNFSSNWHGVKDDFSQILGNQKHMIIRNQKLHVAAVVLVVCCLLQFPFLIKTSLTFLLQGYFSAPQYIHDLFKPHTKKATISETISVALLVICSTCFFTLRLTLM